MASYTLQNENMTAIFSDGLLRSLRLKDQPLEYMGNPENTSYSSILEKNQWMGDWRFRVWQGDRFVEELTSRSRAMQSVEADNMSVTVRYEGEAREEGGLSSLSLCQRFSLKEKALEWEAVLTNRTGERLEVGEASLAFLTNTDFAGIFQDPSLKEVPNWHGEKQRRFHEESFSIFILGAQLPMRCCRGLRATGPRFCFIRRATPVWRPPIKWTSTWEISSPSFLKAHIICAAIPTALCAVKSGTR